MTLPARAALRLQSANRLLHFLDSAFSPALPIGIGQSAAALPRFRRRFDLYGVIDLDAEVANRALNEEPSWSLFCIRQNGR